MLVIVRRIQHSVNPDLKIAGILFTMCEAASDIENNNRPDLSAFSKKVFSTVIPKDNFLSKASDASTPALLLNMMSKGAAAYMDLAQELMMGLAIVEPAA